MAALFKLALSLDASVDHFAFVTCLGQDYVPIGLDGATGKLEIKATLLDSDPLVSVTTTPSSSGSLVFGVALPPPAGASCLTESAIAEHGFPGTVSTVPPVSNQPSVADITALEALDTTSLSEGDVVFVSATPGLFFQWSPDDTRTPNGTTIVLGHGGTGNWLLACTVAITLTAAALNAIAGFDFAVYDLIVTWGDGTTTKLLGQRVYIEQTID